MKKLWFSPHLKAVLQALLVTFLWSTSWVLIKFGLKDIPAVTFAGLRYSLAFLCLLPFGLRKEQIEKLRGLSARDWLRLSTLGVIFYAITQGAQFVGLSLLPAITVNILLNFTAIVVAFLGILWLNEHPSMLQWIGMSLFIFGIVVYFYPVQFPTQQILGTVIVLGGVLANAVSSILGRDVNRSGILPPLLVTMVSMGIGAVILLAGGIAYQGLPRLNLTSWLIVGWLAIVNTAFAFTIWNRTLQQLTAIESTIINGTMLVQIAILAWIFLGERPTIQELGGMVLVGVGAVLVQLKLRQPAFALFRKRLKPTE